MVRQFALVAMAILVAGCGPSPSPTGTSSTEAATSSAASASPRASVDPIVAIATGPWRRQPVQPTADMTDAVEAACRTAEPGIGHLPVALVDLRGRSQLTLVFADGPSGYACWSVLEQPAEAIVVRLEAAAKPVDGIDVALYALAAGPDVEQSRVIGRVGPITRPRKTLGLPIPARVIAGFTDETFVWATYTDPWY